MKSTFSNSGAETFRSIVVIIFILICMVSFIVYTSSLTQRVEEVSVKQVVTEMRGALAMMLYDYAIKGQIRDLQKFDQDNPFVPLAIYRSVPENYQGTISDDRDMNRKGWYFNLSSRRAIYNFADSGKSNQEYLMLFEFEDTNSDGIYDSTEVGYLVIVKS